MHPLRGVGNFPRVVDTLPAKPQNCNSALHAVKCSSNSAHLGA